MRTIWKGHIQFSLVTIPIRLYTAVDSSKTIDFDWLTREEHHPVGYTKTDKVTGKPVEDDQIVKGYEYQPESYVVIEDEDIEKVKPKSSKTIEIEGFVQNEDVHTTLYNKPYFIGPENESAANTYRLFYRALEDTDKTALGKVVLRKRESPVLLTTYENVVLMYKLRYPSQIRKPEKVPYLQDGEVKEEQLDLAKDLIENMSKAFSEIDMENHYYQSLKEMVEAKVEGKEVVSVEEEETEPKDIMTALKESIEKSKKPMKKATGKKKQQASKEKTG